MHEGRPGPPRDSSPPGHAGGPATGQSARECKKHSPQGGVPSDERLLLLERELTGDLRSPRTCQRTPRACSCPRSSGELSRKEADGSNDREWRGRGYIHCANHLWSLLQLACRVWAETGGMNSKSRSDSEETITPEMERHSASDCSAESKRQREQQLLRTCAGFPLSNERTAALDLLFNVAVQLSLRSHQCLKTDSAGSRRCRWWTT